MKRLLIFIISVSLIALLLGCDDITSVGTDVSNDVTDTDISYFSSSADISETSTVPPEDIYEFLKSEYTVTSKRESFGTVYVCEYYFVKGLVTGAKLMTTLPDEETAEEYYELMLEDYPEASLDGLTVTNFLDDDDHYYYGYDLDKLKFVLEKSGYEYTVNFDEAVFADEFYTSVAE